MRTNALLGLAALSVLSVAAACGGDDATSASTPDASLDDGSGGDASPADASLDAGKLDATTDGASPDAGDGSIGDASTDSSSDASTDSSTDSSAVDASADSAADSAADSSADSAADSGGCGPCPHGFTCGTGGYCVSSTGVPAFGHVYVIVMENHSLSSIQGSTLAPYINGLMSTYANATAYTNVAHPSLPNYVAMTSGGTQGIGCDCQPDPNLTACNALCLIFPNCACNKNVDHLGNQLEAAQIEWRQYAEGMGTPCNIASSGNYAVKHVPFLYYDDVRSNATRCTARTRDYGDFAGDLAAGSYRFSMIAPNLCDDMHDTCGGDAIAHGDTWLSTNVPPIERSLGANDVLFIVWDEQDNSLGSAPVPLVVVSKLVRAGSTYTATSNHYNLLATIEDGFGVARLGSAAGLTPITGIWK